MFRYLIEKDLSYPKPPFAPAQRYPEFENTIKDINPDNKIYDIVRNLFKETELDNKNYGTADWNPLGKLIAKHQNIVIKPNLVMHKVGELSCTINSLVVHASVIRVIVDYLLLAAKKQKRDILITILDAPIQSSDFSRLCRENGLTDLMEFYKKQHAPVFLHDTRYEQVVINEHFLVKNRIPLDGDPKGSKVVDLGTLSMHYQPNAPDMHLSIQDYDDSKTNSLHKGTVHQYCFSQTILNSTLVINLCKLKAHAKAGVTLSLKNIVGANVSKDYLPHFRPGGPKEGGDEFSESSFYKQFVRNARNLFYKYPDMIPAPIHSMLRQTALFIEQKRRQSGSKSDYGGGWYGNDTLWRTIIDINRVVFFADKLGKIQNTPQREMLCIVDGIYGMEGEGPIKGYDKYAGLVALGDDPVEFDAKLAYLMGFNPTAIKHIFYWDQAHNFNIGAYPKHITQEVMSNLDFLEPSGWKEHLKR